MPQFLIEFEHRDGRSGKMAVFARNGDAAVDAFWDIVDEERWSPRPECVTAVRPVHKPRLRLAETAAGNMIYLIQGRTVVAVWPATELKLAEYEDAMADPDQVHEWETQGLDFPLDQISHKIIHEIG